MILHLIVMNKTLKYFQDVIKQIALKSAIDCISFDPPSSDINYHFPNQSPYYGS
jgi:hypothetical protein